MAGYPRGTDRHLLLHQTAGSTFFVLRREPPDDVPFQSGIPDVVEYVQFLSRPEEDEKQCEIECENTEAWLPLKTDEITSHTDTMDDKVTRLK